MNTNYLNLTGIEFIEFANKDIGFIRDIFLSFGFSEIKKFKNKDISYFKQNGINILLNNEQKGFSASFSKAHGPAISSMGWKVDNAEYAFSEAVRRGAKAAPKQIIDLPYPAIYGIGDSLIYFIENENIYEEDFIDLDHPSTISSCGFTSIDHLTNNVEKGTMQRWADFYQEIFGFQEERYFDIRGAHTGLTSYALRSPCGTFCIPISEGDEEKSQIEEYLREYNGPGIQHIAFLTEDLVGSLDKLKAKKGPIETLDIIPSYYDSIFDRVPNVQESKEKIREYNILVDGDENGYLLQIFTKNLFGPIFIELLQRNRHNGFGEGNFKALFESIERDQMRRGVL